MTSFGRPIRGSTKQSAPAAIASYPTSQSRLEVVLGSPSHAIDRRGPRFDAAGVFASGRGRGASHRKPPGRYLSREVRARLDSPPFDNSAMDGYAVRASDVASADPDHAVDLPVRGESRAGAPLAGPLGPGAACRIFTGAPMPAGADAVVIQEDTERVGDGVLIREASPRSKHVRAQGSDVSRGAVASTSG